MGHGWFKTLQRILHLAGLEQCIEDEGTYTSSKGQLIIGTHVDNLITLSLTSQENPCECN